MLQCTRRNPIIAEAAEKMMLMEKKGRGIPDMSDQLQKYGLRPPNFAYDGYLIVTLYGREKTPPEYRIQKEFRSSLTDRQLKFLISSGNREELIVRKQQRNLILPERLQTKTSGNC